MQELTQLNDKLDALLKKYASLKSENQRLQDTIAGHVQEIGKLNEKVAYMEENVLATQIDKSTVNNDDKEVMKKQLDTVIGEIDKILSTLND